MSIESDIKLLEKTWKTFVEERKTNIFETLDEHVHPAPAIALFCDEMMDTVALEIDEEEEKSDEELADLISSGIVLRADIILRFGMFLGQHGFDYKNFSQCPCYTIKADTVEEFLAEG